MIFDKNIVHFFECEGFSLIFNSLDNNVRLNSFGDYFKTESSLVNSFVLSCYLDEYNYLTLVNYYYDTDREYFDYLIDTFCLSKGLGRDLVLSRILFNSK